MGLKSSVLSVLLAAPLALGHAHPGGLFSSKGLYQHAAVPLKERSLDHCAEQFADPEFVHKTVKRHTEEFARLKKARGLEAPSPELVARQAAGGYRVALGTNHKSDKKVGKDTDPATLFADAGACMLMPGVTEGPLYVRGEEVRKDITEGQGGIKMTLNIQVMDVSGCKPIPNTYVDIWSSNATGLYTGVQGYPGMGDPNDASILKGTALRGVQPTDENGIATFDGLIPGHYQGRATHIHVIAYVGATKLPNNTISGGRAAFIGQLYFDQTLLTEIRTLAPYAANRQPVTQNAADFLFMQGATGGDPFVRYALVGDKVGDGIFSWIRLGINPARNQAVNPAAFLGPNGGIMNPTGPVAQMGGGARRPGGKRSAPLDQDEQ